MQNLEKETVLSLAVRYGREDLTQMLLNAGAKANHSDQDGMTPLMLASRNGTVAMMMLLLAHQADTTVSNMSEYMALHFAACNGQIKIVQALVRAGANVVFAREYIIGLTPLMSAVAYGHIDLVRYLLPVCLKYDSEDMEITSEEGYTALNLARAVCELLLTLQTLIAIQSNAAISTLPSASARDSGVSPIAFLNTVEPHS
ncbi:hypothetical protein CCR75_002503 [Bremia lactucae]|uniref:Ankyrin repeat protein n=1 Tax=Bremia lactucae TaxID=4779 RepID=A0A976II69_BRELC|nr:hypothetical protein CCR75_002503 [Bremia lactucae]